MPQPRQIVTTKKDIRARLLARAGAQSGRDVLRRLPWEPMTARMREALKLILQGQQALKEIAEDHFASKRDAETALEMTFALDGRLVGDIGELIAAEIFCLDLLGTSSENIDAKTSSGLAGLVQIKATFRDEGLSIKHGSDAYLGLQLSTEGKFRVIYNGPAAIVMDYLKAPESAGNLGRANAGTKLEPLPLGIWALLDGEVPHHGRIPRRQITGAAQTALQPVLQTPVLEHRAST